MASPGTHFGVMLYIYKSNCEDFGQPPGAVCVWYKGKLGGRDNNWGFNPNARQFKPCDYANRTTAGIKKGRSRRQKMVPGCKVRWTTRREAGAQLNTCCVKIRCSSATAGDSYPVDINQNT